MFKICKKYKVICNEKELEEQGFEVLHFNENFMNREISKIELKDYYHTISLYYDRETHILEAYDDDEDKTINCEEIWVKDLIDKGYIGELC